VDVRQPDVLPGWAATLAEFVVAQGETPGATARGPASVLQGVGAGYRRAAERWLPALLVRAPRPVAPGAAAQLAAQLTARLVRSTLRALDFELQVAALTAPLLGTPEASARALPADVEGWLDRLETLPALGYVIGVVCRQWREATAELFDRLTADLPMLEARLWRGAKTEVLTGFTGDAGDPHDGGRSVAILTFDDRRLVVYKTKDLRVGARFMALVDELNAGLPLPLATRAILPRDGYAWEEHVAHAPCRSPDEVRRFYVRMGMQARLAQLVEARDLWLDNLVAAGEQPVFVDLETLLQPRLRAPAGLTAAGRALVETAEESVAPSAVVTLPTTVGRGRRAEDLGALARWRSMSTPLRVVLPGLRAAGASLGTDADGHVVWTPPPFAPVLDGSPADPAAHTAAVVDGYRAMQECLRARPAPVAAFAAGAGDLRVRTIWRGTWDYHAVIQDSLGAEALVDGVAREITLERLFLAALAGGAVDRAVAWIVEHEITALRDLDVPLFLATAGDDALLASRGDRLPAYFEGSAARRLAERAAGLERFATEDHVGVLRSCLGIAAHLRGDPPRPVPRVTPATRADWLGRAAEIGDRLVQWGRWPGCDPATDLVWWGLTYAPGHDLLRVGRLGADLLTGAAGLAVLFADLHAATGRTTFAAAARAALRETETALADAPRRFAAAPGPDSTAPPLALGAFVGVGAWIYTLDRCGRGLAAADLRQRASTLAASIPASLMDDGAPIDAVTGAAGLLLALTVPGSPAPPPALVQRLRERLRGAGPAPASTHPAGTRFLDGLPGAEAAIALALARAGAAPTAPPLEATAGSLLAALAHPAPTTDPALATMVDAFVAQDATAAPSASVLDVVAVALAAFRRTGAARFRERARELGALLVARREATGTWFPETLADDRHNLSVIRGVAAVGHAFLQLHDPHAVASLRCVE
jgi:type 2 lantibiotic biosynthesis protein LanM